MAKGIELPVNVLVIVAIAVMVLIGLVVILGFGTTQATWFTKEAELSSACNSMKQSYGEFCDSADPSSTSVNENKTGVRNLQELCNIQRGCGKVGDTSGKATECCKRSCGCRATIGEATTTTTTT